MLILSRKLSESIVIDGRITVKVLRIDGDVVKLGIAAPSEVPVHRQEVYEEIRQSNQEALHHHLQTLPKLAPTNSDVVAGSSALKALAGQQAKLPTGKAQTKIQPAQR